MLLTLSSHGKLVGDRLTDGVLVVLDAAITDLSSLTADLSAIDTLILDSSRDGVEQITEALQKRPSRSTCP